MITSKTLAQTAVILSGKDNSENKIDAFLNYIKEKNLEIILPQVISHIKHLQSQKKEDETLHIYSKYELSSEDIENIRSTTNAVNADVKQHLDDSVIGGFSAVYNGRIYDGSLKTQVMKLKTMLTR